MAVLCDIGPVLARGAAPSVKRVCFGRGLAYACAKGARMVGRVIDTLETVAEGAAFLAARCPRMEYALGQTGPLPLRRNPQGYGQLLSAIIS